MLPWVKQLRSVVLANVTVRSGQQSKVALGAMLASSMSQMRIGLNVAKLGPPCRSLHVFSAVNRTVVSQSTVPCW